MIRTTNGFAGYSDPELLTKANYIESQMNGNEHFPTPTPTIVQLKEAIASYSVALSAASTRAIEAVAQKNTQKASLVTLLQKLGNYVSAIANGNVDILASSGFSYTKSKSPKPPLEQPAAPLIKAGKQFGTIEVSSKPQKGTSGYQFLVSEDQKAPQADWQTVLSTSSKCTITNLKQGTRYFVKVLQMASGQQVAESPQSSFVTQ